MSGFGAPDFTAMPISDFARSTRLSAIDLALLDEIAERIAHHDQHIGGLAAFQPDRDCIGRGAHRGPKGGQYLVAGGTLEFRHQRLVGGGHSARDHHPDLGGAGGAGKQQGGGEAERECAEICG